MSKILITGASGHLGKDVANKLADKIDKSDISVMVRDKDKVPEFAERGLRVVEGDYNDYDSLVKAFQGVDKLYFVSSSDIEKRVPQHENVVKAAKEAGVGHIIYTSFQRKTEDDSSPIAAIAAGHLAAESAILSSGLPYTILRHNLYTEYIPVFMGQNVLETGTIFLPAGNGRLSAATRTDLASASIAVLTEPGHENKRYDLDGDESLSFTDVANILSELSGKTVQYVSPSPEEFHQALSGAGVPEEAIWGASAFSQAIAGGEFDFPGTTLEQLLGRKPVSIREYLKEAYAL